MPWRASNGLRVRVSTADLVVQLLQSPRSVLVTRQPPKTQKYPLLWISPLMVFVLVQFGGYLPFGMECAAVAAWISPKLIKLLKEEKA